jgi:hypothetical protein
MDSIGITVGLSVGLVVGLVYYWCGVYKSPRNKLQEEELAYCKTITEKRPVIYRL